VFTFASIQSNYSLQPTAIPLCGPSEAELKR